VVAVEDPDLLRVLTGRWGTEDLRSAAQRAALEMRRATASEGPMPTSILLKVAAAAGIHSVLFDRLVPTAGQLLPSGFEFNGWEASIAGSRGSARSRFTCAHEIAHALVGRLGRRSPRKTYSLEERFCDFFAAELLFPEEAARAEGSGFLRKALQSPLAQLEEISRRWHISILVTLGRLNEVQCMPHNLGIAVCRDVPHPQTGGAATPRIATFVPRPALSFYIPRSRRLRSVGLLGGHALFDWWRATCGVERLRAGLVAAIVEANGVQSVIRGPGNEDYWIRESIEASCKASGKWRNERKETDVAYRFYGRSSVLRYSLAAVKWDGGSPMWEEVPNSIE
jgi:hypothetical protein